MQDGNLVLRAIPNPDKSKDNVEMLSGGIETSQSFTFRFGRVECRALVNPFIGNFPAIWMMPKDNIRMAKKAVKLISLSRLIMSSVVMQPYTLRGHKVMEMSHILAIFGCL